MNSGNLVGAVLGGRYDIIEKIGTGGMASVYKAKDNLLNRYVAVKVLRDNLEEEEQIVQNFKKEAQSSAGLTHANIVSVYDVGEEDGMDYMVMEYVDGITLKEYIKERCPLPWQEACDFTIQIGKGIKEAHNGGIIHRDIKPQNILMTKDKTLKVTDFGIARAAAAETTIVGGGALGSVQYISPEQARGGFTDERSDIYSLGIVMYEMLTGKVPFNGDNAVSVALMHLEKEPVNVKCLNLDMPSDLAYVTMKAISKEQHARYQNVEEMLEDLHAVLAEEPLPSKERSQNEAVNAQNIANNGAGHIINPVIGDDEDDDFYDADEEGDYYEEDYDDYDDDEYEDDEVITGRENRKTKAKKKKKKPPKTPEQKKQDRLAVILAIATAVVALLIVLGIYFIMEGSKEAIVPNVENMTVQEATIKIEQAGLKVADEMEYSLSDTVEDGKVISQDPEAKKMIRKNKPVKLIVSIGSSGGNIPAPDVQNQKFENAIATIIGAGLTYAVREDYSDTVPSGQIIRQLPQAGTKLNEGDIITLHVSKGANSSLNDDTAAQQQNMVTVPGLTGKTREQCEAALAAVGLNLGNTSRKASGAPEGTVISQSPSEGKSVASGSFVGIVISSGNAVSTMPQDKTQSGEGEQGYTLPDYSQTDTSNSNNTTENNSSHSAADNGSGSAENTSSENTGESAPVRDMEQGNTQNSSSNSETGDTSSSGGVSTQSYTVMIPEAVEGNAEVEIVVDGKTVHDAVHNSSEGSVTVQISGSGTASVQAYVNGSKVSDKKISFN